MTGHRFSLLPPYTAGSAGIYRCPSDRHLSQPQHAAGWSARVRSVSLNACKGEGFISSTGRKPVGAYTKGMRWFGRVSELVELSPAQAVVFLDEHPDSVDDALYYFGRGQVWNGPGGGWSDLPSNVHDGAFTVGCADGHAERILLKSIARRRPVSYMRYPIIGEHAVRPHEEADFWRMMARLTLPIPED